MLARLAPILLLGASLGYGCDCFMPDFQHTRKAAEVIFEGKIVAFRNSGVGRSVVFSVDRVWKGDVGATFEMFAWDGGESCNSFPYGLLEVGNQLLVYAAHRGMDTLVTGPCSRTSLASSSKDFQYLGSGRKPKSK